MLKENTSSRLKTIMKERNLRQVDILEKARPFCEKYGVKLNKSDLSQYVSGIVEPGQEKLTILGEALGVNEAWLMGYSVPQNRASASQIVSETKLLKEMKNFKESIIEIYGKDAIKLLENYNELNDFGKHEANKRVEELTWVDRYLASPITDEDLSLEIIDMAAHDDDNAVTEDPFNAIDDIKGVIKKADQQRNNRGR